MAESGDSHVHAKVFWILKFLLQFWLCLHSFYLMLSILNWVCFWGMFNNDTVSMDANPGMSMFATTGSKEVNLETELFSLIPCGYACSSFCGWCVLCCWWLCGGHNWCHSWAGSISVHKNCTRYLSPLFCFCFLSHMMYYMRPHGHTKAADLQIFLLLWSSCVAFFKLTLWNQN